MGRSMLSDEELDDLLSLAGEARPVSRAALDDESVRCALDDTWHRTQSNAGRRQAARRARRRVSWRELAATGLAVGVLGGASFFVAESLKGVAGGPGLALAVSPAAAAQLDRVAYVAAAQPGLTAGQWQYVERLSREHTANSSGAVRVQDWFAPSGVERERVSLAGAVTSDRVYADPSEGYAPTPGVNLAAPPSDVKTLLSDIAGAPLFHGSSPADDAGGYWDDLANVLLRSTSPQLRSLVFTALKYLPGVTALANQTDQLGRAGTAFSVTREGETSTVVVSPSTGELLESYDTYTRAFDGIPAGAAVNRITYVRQSIVDSDTALPGGDTQPLTASEPTTTTPAKPTPAQALTEPVAPSPTPPSATQTTPTSSATTR
jgi:hypothetical protein